MCVMQELTIRDLTTGQLFVLAAEESFSSSSAPKGHLTDVATGHKVRLDDFDGVLGQAAGPKV